MSVWAMLVLAAAVAGFWAMLVIGVLALARFT
jgi:hypothetical protein